MESIQLSELIAKIKTLDDRKKFCNELGKAK